MFVKLSKDTQKRQTIHLDNLFLTDYLPYAPDVSVKVYLYGLGLISSGVNEIETIAANLNVSEDEVFSAYKYWEEQGLVNILSVSPPMVEYKEIKPAIEQIRYFKKAKYKSFNDMLHAMTEGRTLLPNEYNEYYLAMESLHIEQEAMLAIIAYCIRLKGINIGYPYIMTVARSLAAEGITTFERVNEHLTELDLYGEEIKEVLKALGLKRKPDIADKRLWIKWTNSFGFNKNVIVKVAKLQKKGGIDKLDSTLNKYYESRLLSFEEIEKYNSDRDKMVALTAQIVRILGKYYDRLDYIIETYTQKWLTLGFSDDALISIADYCFRKNKRNLDDMDSVIDEFYAQGLLSREGIDVHKTETAKSDEAIKKVLSLAGIERNVNTWDRDSYNTWTYSWNMPPDVIEYAAVLSSGKGLGYVNGILANWNLKNIRSVEAAKKSGSSFVPQVTSAVAATVTKKSLAELELLVTDVSVEDM